MSKSAVLVVGYNRPDLIRKTLSVLAEYQPTKLYFACEGPRSTRPKDAQLVSETKKSIEDFRWHGPVATLFQTKNLGLRKNMIAAIDWFFAHEPEGIILEDDCVPGLDFFALMQHILDNYRDEPRVWGATGSNPSRAPVAGNASYGFVRSALVWGWASWADRWALYDRDLTKYGDSGLAGKKRLWKDPFEYHALDWHLRQIARGQFDSSWAYPWGWTVVHADGLWAAPAKNLISNVGFRSDGTHTTSATALRQTLGYLGEIRGPASIERDIDLQHFIHKKQHRVFEPLCLNYLRNAFRVVRARWRFTK